MSTLYYAICVATPDECCVFRRPTNLSFVSPVGTAIHISFAGGCFAQVSGYSHDDYGDFNVFLSPLDPRNLELVNVRVTPEYLYFFVIPNDQFEGNKEVLIQDGWNIGDGCMDDICSYPPPFHRQCRQ